MKFAYFNVLITECKIMPVLALLFESVLLEAVVLLMTTCPHRHSTGWLWVMTFTIPVRVALLILLLCPISLLGS